jgi:hypothetical protein
MTRSLLTLAFVALLSNAVGCGRPVTADELDRLEARSYQGRSRGEVLKATVTALRSLGYEVVSVDQAAGRVKTAPKIVVVHAARTSSSTAIASGDAVAWTIDVSGAKGGAQLHAEPRLYSGGQNVETTRLNETYAQRLFTTLYGEIDSSLPGTATTTTAGPLHK